MDNSGILNVSILEHFKTKIYSNDKQKGTLNGDGQRMNWNKLEFGTRHCIEDTSFIPGYIKK